MPMNPAEYPPNWREISKRIRFERAGNCCEWCGAENGRPHPVTGSKVVLTVAHKDHEKWNCDGLEKDIALPLQPEHKSNLAALCQRDHLAHDQSRHIYNRKYGRDTREQNYDLFDAEHPEIW